jgi:DNA-binding NarL/FixJ family response regulator
MAALEHLTRREQMVLELVCAGLTNPEIAQALCVEPRTVRTYLERVADKLCAPNRTTVAVVAISSGLVCMDRIRALWNLYRPQLASEA